MTAGELFAMFGAAFAAMETPGIIGRPWVHVESEELRILTRSGSRLCQELEAAWIDGLDGLRPVWRGLFVLTPFVSEEYIAQRGGDQVEWAVVADAQRRGDQIQWAAIADHEQRKDDFQCF